MDSNYSITDQFEEAESNLLQINEGIYHLLSVFDRELEEDKFISNDETQIAGLKEGLTENAR